MPGIEWTTPAELPPISDLHHQVRRLQSALMDTAGLARDYLAPAEPPVWVELFRLMGSWHLNEVTDLSRYFNLRFPRHGMAVLEARGDITKWLESARSKLHYSTETESAALRDECEKLSTALSKIEDIIRQCGIGEALH